MFHIWAVTQQTCTKRDSNRCSQTSKTGFLGSWPICKHPWPKQACANVQSCQTLHCCQRRDVDEGSGQHLGIKPHQKAAHNFLRLCTYVGLDARKPVFGVCKQQRRRPAWASAQSDNHLCFKLIESIISKIASSEFSIFYLVSVAKETGCRKPQRQVFLRFMN